MTFASVEQLRELRGEFDDAKGEWLLTAATLERTCAKLSTNLELTNTAIQNLATELRSRTQSLPKVEEWIEDTEVARRAQKMLRRRMRPWLKYGIGFVIAVAEAIAVKVIADHQHERTTSHDHP